MLKAVFNSKYRKASGWVLTYSVNGPAQELAEYIAIASASANIAPDQWRKTEAGLPLFFLPLNNVLRNGETPQPSYTLIKSHDGLRFFTDTSAQDMARYARVAQASELEEGKLMAQVRMGMINIGTQQRPALPAQPAIAAPAIKANDAIEDLINSETGEEEPLLQGEGSGSETL